MIQSVATDAAKSIRIAYELDNKIAACAFAPKNTTTTYYVGEQQPT